MISPQRRDGGRQHMALNFVFFAIFAISQNTKWLALVDQNFIVSLITTDKSFSDSSIHAEYPCKMPVSDIDLKHELGNII